jgi:hypothetical protein
MYQKNLNGVQNCKFNVVRDLDVISNLMMPMDTSNLAFTPTTMRRMENSLMGFEDVLDSDSDSFSDDSNLDMGSMTSSSTKRQKTSGASRQLPGPKARRRLEDMTPEEVNRRQRRRERNKAAAARCRQRRVDLTNQLLTETQQLESEGQRLEREIENLRRDRDQLVFILEAHKPVCRAVVSEPVKVEQTQNDNFQSMHSIMAVRPKSLPIANNVVPVTSDFSFGLGSTGVTPIVSESGPNPFLSCTVTDFMSPSVLLSSPSPLFV